MLFRALAFAFAVAYAHAQTYDLLITGGRIVDGAGTPWYHGDVAITGDRIVAIGRLTGRDARRKLDATGLVVAPGFIDIHSHAVRDAKQNPAMENLIRQGITTILDGQDGSSAIPLGPVMRNLLQHPISVNVGFFVGQGSVRREVIGLVNRKATVDEINRMQQLVRGAMRDGAFGLSTGLFYVPGNFTPIEEVIALAKVVGKSGGIHISHMRDEAANILDSVRETIRIGEEGRLPTQITHHKVIGKASWGNSDKTLKLIEEARARGVDVTIDQYPYTASHTGSAALFPQWSSEGGPDSLKERLKAPDSRARIKQEIVRRIREDRGGGDPQNVQFARCSFDSSLDGKTLSEATRRAGLEASIENAAEVAMGIQEKGGCSTIYHAMSEKDVERIMRSPWSMIASDGDAPIFGNASPHPRSYGTFPRVLGRYVREKRLLSLEEAIRKMTGLPAARLKLFDRGLLRPGMKADMVVFDPDTIADRSEYLNPYQYAVGVKHVLVNAQLVLFDGAMTGLRPGLVLKRPNGDGANLAIAQASLQY